MEDSKIVNLALLVKDLIRIIHLPKRVSGRPVGIILVGPPFSGKTTFVKLLASQFPLAVLSESDIGAFLAPRATFFQRGSEEIFVLASKTIEELTRQKICSIYDASINKRAERALLKKLVTEAGGRLVLIHFTMPEEEAFMRLEKINAQIIRGDRKGFIMDRDLLRFELHNIEAPPPEENPIIVNTTNLSDIEGCENRIRALLKE